MLSCIQFSLFPCPACCGGDIMSNRSAGEARPFDSAKALSTAFDGVPCIAGLEAARPLSAAASAFLRASTLSRAASATTDSTVRADLDGVCPVVAGPLRTVPCGCAVAGRCLSVIVARLISSAAAIATAASSLNLYVSVFRPASAEGVSPPNPSAAPLSGSIFSAAKICCRDKGIGRNGSTPTGFPPGLALLPGIAPGPVRGADAALSKALANLLPPPVCAERGVVPPCWKGVFRGVLWLLLALCALAGAAAGGGAPGRGAARCCLRASTSAASKSSSIETVSKRELPSN
mmetsp:Transcript_2902/g.7049  ORF Transcript_2902/g.7049 Transcript_2902/m.7049 type:complete len:290 (+) Transcript_2902:93-962(+)